MQINNSVLKSWLKHIKCCHFIEESYTISKNWLVDSNKDIEKILSYFEKKVSLNYKIDSLYKDKIDIIAQNIHEHSMYFIITQMDTYRDIYSKLIHSILTSLLLFNRDTSYIIVALPIVNEAMDKRIETFILDTAKYFQSAGYSFKFFIYTNDSYNKSIVAPLLLQADKADDSEMFLKSFDIMSKFNIKQEIALFDELEEKTVIENSVDISKDIGLIDKEFFINRFEDFKSCFNSKIDKGLFKSEVNSGLSFDRFSIIERIFEYELEVSVLEFILSNSPEFERKKQDLLLKAKKLIQKYG
jgi:hypothetical protein